MADYYYNRLISPGYWNWYFWSKYLPDHPGFGRAPESWEKGETELESYNPELCGSLAILSVWAPLRGPKIALVPPQRSPHGVPHEMTQAKLLSCC